jgi:GDP-L-fucose synthase
MTKKTKHLVIGSTGLLGSAFMRKYGNDAIGVSSKDFDATSLHSVHNWLLKARTIFNYPKLNVYLCMGTVRGFIAQNNLTLLIDNAQMAMNVLPLLNAYHKNEGKIVYFSSSCVYPTEIGKETDLLTGPFESSNEGYGLAKAIGTKITEYFNAESHGNNKFLTMVPPNLYGPNDNWDPRTSHVLPGMTRKIGDVAKNRGGVVNIMGSSSTRREFMRSDDVVSATEFIINHIGNDAVHDTVFNVGVGSDITLGSVAYRLNDSFRSRAMIEFDQKEENIGKPKKMVDNSKLVDMGWLSSYTYDDMINFLVEEYKKL